MCARGGSTTSLGRRRVTEYGGGCAVACAKRVNALVLGTARPPKFRKRRILRVLAAMGARRITSRAIGGMEDIWTTEVQVRNPIPVDEDSTNENTAGEGLHLAAVTQYCGIRSVVGTMWAMSDKDE
ncbi:hypothetical protein H4582DRAFT_2128247 [Lactarius indigo]|nr:hypothetical protein H4582DRAFT_2128247 [Lactarius indigo]